MLTVEHVHIFIRFGGDIDALQRSGAASEQAMFGAGEWGALELALHLLRNVRDGHGGPELVSRAQQLRREVVTDAATWQALERLAAETTL